MGFDWSRASTEELLAEDEHLTADFERLRRRVTHLERDIKQHGRTPERDADFLLWWKMAKDTGRQRDYIRKLLQRASRVS